MALQHLRSSTADKRPTPAAMSDGQLALNTNLVSPGLFFKDSNGDSVKIGPVHVGTTAPNVTPGAGGQAGNSKGEAWLDTTAANPILKVWNGSAFVAVQPVGTGTVVSTADTGTVTSTMILDGTILNADINASAAIVDTKLATIATGGKVSGTAITSGNISTSGSFASTSTVTGTNLIPTGSGVPTNGIYLPAANSVAVATNGTQRLTVDTAATTSTLPVVHPLGAVGTPSITFTGDLNTGFWSPSADALAASTAGSERLRITSAGLVGIGTSAPDTLLTVSQSAPTDGILAKLVNPANASGSEAGIRLQHNNSTQLQCDLVTFRSGANAGLDFNIKLSDSAGTPQTRFTILEGGNVGIGTTSPGSLLHLADAGNITVGTTTGTKIGTATTQKIGFYNATPVVQPAAVANATTAIDVITQLNDLLAKLRTLGIIAT